MVCAWCCVKCRPRYKRHVDNIFPVDPQDGLVKGEMQKLTYYALTNPRKLDRIGNYLAEYLKYYVDHRRYDFAKIAMKAMEQLLQACRSASINLFVESFLRMVQKLLESPEASLQVLGSTSFVHFANIQEDTPSYHRRYDFFVSKFSSMCWSNGRNDTIRPVRQAGLRGLQGVILKTVSDDLQVNIWEEVHIQKIMRALLFNIHEGFTTSVTSPSQSRSMSPWEGENSDVTSDIDPDQLARHVLQDLVSRASYGQIKSLMMPLLYFIDNQKLWIPNKFPTHCMSLIMHSIQMSSAYIAIAQLLAHLEEHKDASAKLRCSIVEVVSAAVSIASTESIGPTILEMFGSLLKYLKMSVDTCNIKNVDVEIIKEEDEFQDTIVQSVGHFSHGLQTYQKIEICTFILQNMPSTTDTEEETQFESMLLKCIMKITTSINMNNDKSIGLPTLFPLSLLVPLQRLSLSDSPKTRTMTQQIFHSILDRHNNHEKVVPTVTLGELPEENIFVGPQKKQDVLFFKRNGPEVYFHLYESILKEDNDLDNYTCTFRTAVLWCLEVPVDEVLIELIHMAFGLQDEACSSSRNNVNILHGLVAAFLVFASRYSRNEALDQHITNIIRKRQSEKPHLLPQVAFSTIDKDSELDNETAEENVSSVMFDATVVAECLNQQGMNVDRLSDPYHYKRAAIPRTPESVKSLRVSLLDARVSDVQISLQEEITFDTLKQALQHRQQMALATNNSSKERLLSQESYEDSVARTAEKMSHITALKQQIFSSFKSGDVSPTESLHSLIDLDNLTNLSIDLPDMYVY